MMNEKNKKILIIAVVSLALIAGVVTGIFFYMGKDRRAVGRAVKRLGEDLEMRMDEAVSPGEYAHVADGLMYGESKITYSVNIGGINVSSFAPAQQIAGLESITLGTDGVINRNCPEHLMSVNTDLSVMNYDLTGMEAYVSGNTLLVGVPELFDSLYEIDIDQFGVNLFPEKEKPTPFEMVESLRERFKTAEYVRQLKKDAKVTLEKEKREMISGDGTVLYCKVYHVLIPGEPDEGDPSGQGDRDGMNVRPKEDTAITLWIDEYNDIRRMITDEPVRVNDDLLDIDVQLAGADLPIDSICADLHEYGPDITVHTQIDRVVKNTDIAYAVETETGVDMSSFDLPDGVDPMTAEKVSMSAQITPKYDPASDTLDISYSGFVFSIDDKELFRSSGSVIIETGTSDQVIIPDKERETDIRVIAAEAVMNIYLKDGDILDALGIGL